MAEPRRKGMPCVEAGGDLTLPTAGAALLVSDFLKMRFIAITAGNSEIGAVWCKDHETENSNFLLEI
ncbi:hypothetical protein FKM82_000972 [Ascaphus truei]